MAAKERTGLFRPSAPISRRAARGVCLLERVRWGQEERSRSGDNGSVDNGSVEGPKDIEETEVLSIVYIGGRDKRRVRRARRRLAFSVMYAIVLEGFEECGSQSKDIRAPETPSQTCMR